MPFIKIIPLAFSVLSLYGCYDTQTIIKTEIKHIDIPQQLLEVKPIQRPVINNESDIIDAYIDLYKEYLLLFDKINAIKELNGNNARKNL